MLNRKTGLVVLLACFVATEIRAATLTNYAVGDVLICFRKASSGNDLVVDAGPIATFTNATINQRIPITQFTGTQLGLVGTNAVSWSAFTWSDDTVSPVSSQGTLFMTKARSNPSVKNSSTWASSSHDSQLLLINSELTSIPAGAKSNLGFKSQNTTNAIVEPDDTSSYLDGQSYSGALIGSDSLVNFNGFFQGNPEKTTLANFTTLGAVVRSDFYQIPPSESGDPVKYLGVFEFNTNGAMTYVAYATPPTAMTVAATSITGTGAQLNSMVNPNSDNTTFYFQYGLTTSYGSTTVSSNIGTVSNSYGLAISSLIASTTYHYRVAAYNEYGTNFGGDLTFTTSSGSSAPAVPVITYFNRTTNLTTIAYTTGAGGTYTLRGTNSTGLTAAKTNWPAIASVAGNGLIHTNTDPDTGSVKFYVITAQ
jgi:hypothetical protein